MAKIRIKGDTSGYIDIAAPAVAGAVTLNLPSTNGDVVTTAGANFTGNVDVTGTVTSDGMTVDGNVTFTAGDRVIGNGDEKIKFNSTDQDIEFQTADIVALVINSSQDFGFAKATPSNWASNYVGMNIGSTGSMYARIDGVQIFSLGSNSYYDGSNNKYIGSDPASNMYFYNGEIVFRNAPSGTADGNLTFQENVRIDSTGRLLVGVTSFAYNSNGVGLRDTDYSYFTTTGNAPLLLNRKTSDGDILRLYRDATQVGSIGGNADGLFIAGKSDTGLFLNDTEDLMYPMTTSFVNRDNVVTLGAASARFKDLYLGGGVYVGGTGSANYLDDYEEGDYTATITPGGGSVALYGIYNQLGYTKVGRMVTVIGQIVVYSVSTPSGGFTVNLPFVVADLTDLAGRSFTSVISYFNGTGVTNGYYNTWCRALEGTSEMQVYALNGTSIDTNTADWLGPGSDIIVNVTYFTTA